MLDNLVVSFAEFFLNKKMFSIRKKMLDFITNRNWIMSLINDNGGQCERMLGDNWQSINLASTIEDSGEEVEAAFRAPARAEQGNQGKGNDEIISLSFRYLWNFAHFPVFVYLRHYSRRITFINLYFFYRNDCSVTWRFCNLWKSFRICDQLL